MADSTSASGSGGSGHSERTPRNIPRINGLPSNPKITNYDSSRDDKSPSVDEQSLVGNAVQHIQGNRETVKQAVEIVLRATAKKPRMKGAISLCTEVASLLETIRRLENRIIIIEKREKDSLRNSKGCHGPGSLSLSSTESSRLHKRRATQTKITQVQPVLTDRSTSPLLKEIHVKSSNTRACQTEVTSIVKDTTDRELENVQLKKELYDLRTELEELKKKQSLFPMITGNKKTASKAASHLDQPSKSTNIVPVPPAQRQSGPVNQQIELPDIPQAKSPGQGADSKTKICINQQQRKGFRPLSSPVKGSSNLSQAAQHQPIRPIDMYSQCKCPGCVRALAEESGMTLSCHTDRKSHKSEILPSIGDHVVARSHLTGTVKYIGPVSGEESYIGLHLDSPVGNHSGSLDGVQYFSCPPNYGTFVHIEDVLCITTPKTIKGKQAAGSSTACQRSSPTSVAGLHPKKKNVAQGS